MKAITGTFGTLFVVIVAAGLFSYFTDNTEDIYNIVQISMLASIHCKISDIAEEVR